MAHVDNIYLGGDASLQCSEAMAEAIDRKVIEIVKERQENAAQILRDNIGTLHRLAEYLYREEVMNGETFPRLLNEPSALPA